MGATEAPEKLPLNHKEREHLDVLQRRLDHLREDRPERSGDPDYFPGEANAIAWALSLLGNVEPEALRLERVDRAVRKVATRLGRIEQTVKEIEKALEEEDEEP